MSRMRGFLFFSRIFAWPRCLLCLAFFSLFRLCCGSPPVRGSLCALLLFFFLLLFPHSMFPSSGLFLSFKRLRSCCYLWQGCKFSVVCHFWLQLQSLCSSLLYLALISCYVLIVLVRYRLQCPLSSFVVLIVCSIILLFTGYSACLHSELKLQ